MITPTIGRKVWYYPSDQDLAVTQRLGDQPYDASVVFVHGDRMVNLVVWDHIGMFFSRTSVQLLQDGDPAVGGGISYCEWMPYQKGQAAKHEALEKEKANA